jgi:hypothetical protein
MLSTQLHPQHAPQDSQVISLIHRNDHFNPITTVAAIEPVGCIESPVVEQQMEALHDRVEKFQHIQHLREMQNDNFAVRAFKRLVRHAA